MQHGGEDEQCEAEQGHSHIMRESNRYGKLLRNSSELGIIPLA